MPTHRAILRTALHLNFVWLGWLITTSAHAHGIAGNRYFPGTLTFDDPAVADELIVPNFSATSYPGNAVDRVNDTTYGLSFARLLTPDLALQADSGWTRWTRPNQPTQHGFDTTSVGFKARLYENDPHETLLSVSLDWGLPNSGSTAVGAGRPGSIQPGVFMGKGFGDLPDGWSGLRPFGVAAGFEGELPVHRRSTSLELDPATDQLATLPATNPDMLHWGFALEYSTLYLTDRFTGGPPKEEPLRQWVPLVELAFDTPLSAGGKHTATANPGLSYVAVTWQLAAEAVIPLNRASGSGVGGRIQLLFFLDDLVPALFGKPLLSERPVFSRGP